MIDLYSLDPSRELYDIEKGKKCRVYGHSVSGGCNGWSGAECTLELIYPGHPPRIEELHIIDTDGKLKLEGFKYVEQGPEVKTRWRDISQEYNWKAQDENGQWWGYKNKPFMVTGFNIWTAAGKSNRLSAGTPNPQWKSTRSQRPRKTYMDTIRGINQDFRDALRFPGDPLTISSNGCFKTTGGKGDPVGFEFCGVIDEASSDMCGALDGAFLHVPHLSDRGSDRFRHGLHFPTNVDGEFIWETEDERKLVMQLAMGRTTGNNCPEIKTLTPREQIQGKVDRLEAQMKADKKKMMGRIAALTAVVDSIKWTVATDEIKNKAVARANEI